MSQKPVTVEYGGDYYTLRDWAVGNFGSYDRSLQRWKRGVRDPIELVYGKNRAPDFSSIPQSEIDWLKSTRYMREGMDNEWKVSCDLIGLPYVRLPELRKLVLG